MSVEWLALKPSKSGNHLVKIKSIYAARTMTRSSRVERLKRIRIARVETNGKGYLSSATLRLTSALVAKI